ncbi:MAG: hypothetical protein Q9227_000362 [Pyrenula ochraceoflavens]
MVYDWDGKRDACYDLYIRQRQSLDEIMQGFRNIGFTPSKRAFQTQFKRWGFPSKQNPAHKNIDLVARVKQLWEGNVTQRDMLTILNDEGYDIKERELMRVRTKNRWLLRCANGMKAKLNGEENDLDAADTYDGEEDSPHDEPQLNALQEDGKPQEDSQEASPITQNAKENKRQAATPKLAPEVVEQRKRRREEMQKESDERMASRKRRRRTRGWGGLPADPPAPPRFPSETTIDESKAFLSLDSDNYREVRDHFQRICEEMSIKKKTLAGPEQWHAAKDRLIHESPPLQNVFWSDNSNLEQKALALDVICGDVTKRMRTLERRMTIADAKNILGINPEESRLIRNAFYAILKADHFTSKIEAGDDHWKELKAQWISVTPLVQTILAPGNSDPEHANKLKAVEVLCRDVMKRLRDDQVKADPNHKVNKPVSPVTKKTTSAPNTSKSRNASSNVNASTARNVATSLNPDISNGISSLASRALASAPLITSDVTDMQIDPSLLEAAAGTALEEEPPLDLRSSLAVYFRLGPQSTANGQNLWLGSLKSRSHNSLHQAISERYPDTSVERIDGVEKVTNGKELSWQIDNDDELDAYLDHMRGKKATFVVHVEGL